MAFPNFLRVLATSVIFAGSGADSGFELSSSVTLVKPVRSGTIILTVSSGCHLTVLKGEFGSHVITLRRCRIMIAVNCLRRPHSETKMLDKGQLSMHCWLTYLFHCIGDAHKQYDGTGRHASDREAYVPSRSRSNPFSMLCKL